MGDRELDVVLLGATGYVGRLTAAHLARHAPDGVRVALAGRSAERLSRLRDDLAVDWPTVLVDTSDATAVRDLTARTTVMATTVGPYLRYGREVVAACASAGTHYADLTGETAFVVGSIEANHVAAEATMAKIVHSCGFDSIPSDLGVGLAHALLGGPIEEAVYQVRSARGGVSGGTIDSLRQQVIEAKRDPGLRRAFADPYAMCVDPPPRTTGNRSFLGLRRDPDTARWQAPFVMGTYNRQVVHRSNYLTGWAYGRSLRYRETVDTGRGPVGLLSAGAVTVGLGALTAGLWAAPTRAVLDRLLPRPGEGPSEAALKRGRLRIEVDVWPVDGMPVRSSLSVALDPGYRGTAVMLGQSALSLLSDDLPARAGVLTPMTAMGEALAARLRSHGFDIETRPLG